MGFKPPCKVFKLTFADGDWAGLEVVCREGSVDAYENLTGVPDDPKRRAEAFTVMCESFAPVLVSWNLEDPLTGQPTPPTLAGLRSHTITTVSTIVGAWLDAVLMHHPAAEARQGHAEQAVEELGDAGELEQQLLAASTTAA